MGGFYTRQEFPKCRGIQSVCLQAIYQLVNPPCCLKFIEGQDFRWGRCNVAVGFAPVIGDLVSSGARRLEKGFSI